MRRGLPPPEGCTGHEEMAVVQCVGIFLRRPARWLTVSCHGLRTLPFRVVASLSLRVALASGHGGCFANAYRTPHFSSACYSVADCARKLPIHASAVAYLDGSHPSPPSDSSPCLGFLASPSGWPVEGAGCWLPLGIQGKAGVSRDILLSWHLVFCPTSISTPGISEKQVISLVTLDSGASLGRGLRGGPLVFLRHNVTR